MPGLGVGRHATKPGSTASWVVLSAWTPGKTVVEGRDGWSVLALQSDQENRQSVCWEFVGASVVDS